MSSLFGRVLASTERQLDIAVLLVRANFGLVLAFSHGLGKIRGLAGFTEIVAGRGLPAPGALALLAALSEFAGGLLLALGLLTRAAAAAVLGTMLVAFFVIHGADPFAKKELALCYAAVALALLIGGGGKLSVDRLLQRRR